MPEEQSLCQRRRLRATPGPSGIYGKKGQGQVPGRKGKWYRTRVRGKVRSVLGNCF